MLSLVQEPSIIGCNSNPWFLDLYLNLSAKPVQKQSCPVSLFEASCLKEEIFSVMTICRPREVCHNANLFIRRFNIFCSYAINFPQVH